MVEPTRHILDKGVILRSLETDDATLVDSWWEYQSATSHSLVSRRIDIDGGVACLGIEVDGTLVACILRYEGGALGMLHVQQDYRRRGYAQILLEEATRTLQNRGEDCVAFIVDGNTASESLFTKLGWKRADVHMKKQTGKRRAKRKWITIRNNNEIHETSAPTHTGSQICVGINVFRLKSRISPTTCQIHVRISCSSS